MSDSNFEMAGTSNMHRPRPTAGVAMCIYNAGPYLKEQLDSIAVQSVLPDRMVVLDDGSTDGSWEIVQAWARDVPFPVVAQRNEQTLGVVRNFERAMSLVSEDIVFLADQDDIWYPDKMRLFLDVFTADAGVGLLHSDADLVDSKGAPMGRRLFDTLLVTPGERSLVAAGEAWKVYAKRNLVTGAACAFRRELLVHAIPFSHRWVHDEWLAFITSLVSRVQLLDEPTMAYRLHGGNAVGMPLPTLGWRLRTTIQAFANPTKPGQRARADRLEEIYSVARELGAAPEVLDHLRVAAEHARFRANLPRNPAARLSGIVRERRAGHYDAWSNGPVSMLHDLLIAR